MLCSLWTPSLESEDTVRRMPAPYLPISEFIKLANGGLIWQVLEPWSDQTINQGIVFGTRGS